MTKKSVGNVILAIIMMMILCSQAPAGRSKSSTLQQKMDQISTLQVRLIDNIDLATETRNRLQQQLNELCGEIRSERIREGIDSHQRALQNLRICYNLNLIQRLYAYLNGLDERIAYFQAGRVRLRFLMHQIKDDMAIIHTLKDMEIEKLLTRIDHVLGEYIPETEKKIIDTAQIRRLPIERLWEDLDLDTGEIKPGV